MPPKSSTYTPLSPQAFIHTQLSLLQAEQATEVSENTLLLSAAPPTVLARAGLAILNLTISSLRTGLGGRTVLELVLDPAYTPSSASTSKKSGGGERATREGELPEHGIRTGDIVRVGEMPKGGARKKEVSELTGRGFEGVVTRVGERAVWVAVGKGDKDVDEGKVDELGSGRLWVVKLANDVTYKRMNLTLNNLLNTPSESYTTLQRVLLGLSKPTVPSQADIGKYKDIVFLNTSLNTSQRSAIQFALAAPDIALIHGPPGTGKTATIVELILQFLEQKLRILVCGPSNISVDNIVERLHAQAPATPMIRLGHPARLLPGVLDHSLEVLTRTSEAGQIVSDVRKEMDEKIASVRKAKSGRERKAIWGEVRELRKEFRDREGRCADGLVSGASVVCATLHGAGGRQIFSKMKAGKGFDVVIVDEAAQGLEAGCWVPLVAAGESVRKLVLAGDHLQLPPTVKSSDDKVDKEEMKKRTKSLKCELAKLAIDENEMKQAKKWTLDRTMFDRLLEMYGVEIKRLLNVQYRMHEKIMRFPSDELYEGELVADSSVRLHLLKDLEYGVEATEDTSEPLVFYDTQGGDFPEKTEDEGSGNKSTILGDSKSNELEAAIVKMHVKKLIDTGVRDEDIAVITPYNAQLAVLQSMLREPYPGLELGSVDGFQGREKEAVLVSLVRSNDDREVGFLGEKRRLNVAMSRPKRHLCVIGDSETVGSGSSFLKRWMKFLEENADLRYPTLHDFEQG